MVTRLPWRATPRGCWPRSPCDFRRDGGVFNAGCHNPTHCYRSAAMSYRMLRRVSLALVSGWLLACGKDSTAPQGTPPTLQGVSPATGTVGTELTLTGTDFRAGASVMLDNAAADSVQVANATTAYALVPAGVAVGHAYAVTIRNSDGTSAQLNGVFTVAGWRHRGGTCGSEYPRPRRERAPGPPGRHCELQCALDGAARHDHRHAGDRLRRWGPSGSGGE